MQTRWLGCPLSIGTVAIVALSAPAVELANGTTAFLQPPQFVEAVTTEASVMRRNATYFFTLDLPANADAPLQAVVIEPQNLTRQLQPYRLDKTTAFAEIPGDDQQVLGLGDISVNDETKAVTVEFDPPVAPGRLVTIGLRPQRNPRFDGVYVFRVTAVPEGDRPQSHIAGHGRLYFIDNDRDRIFH